MKTDNNNPVTNKSRKRLITLLIALLALLIIIIGFIFLFGRYTPTPVKRANPEHITKIVTPAELWLKNAVALKQVGYPNYICHELSKASQPVLGIPPVYYYLPDKPAASTLTVSPNATGNFMSCSFLVGVPSKTVHMDGDPTKPLVTVPDLTNYPAELAKYGFTPFGDKSVGFYYKSFGTGLGLLRNAALLGGTTTSVDGTPTAAESDLSSMAFTEPFDTKTSSTEKLKLLNKLSKKQLNILNSDAKTILADAHYVGNK